MKRRSVFRAIAGCCLLWLGGLGMGLLAAASPGEEKAIQRQTSAVHLYFADKANAYLVAERRTVNHPDGPAGKGESILAALFSGSRQGLLSTVPAGTSLRALYLTPEGTAYVDLSQTVSVAHPGGAQAELLTVYAIVNSLVLNVPRIKAVKILVEGRETRTLAGHVELRFPLKANMALIR